MSPGPGGASRHWRFQRLTAIALIPLGLWFLAVLLRQPSLDHAIVTALFAKPLQSLLAALLGAALLWHSMQGLQVVFEDYVRGRLLVLSLAVLRIAHLAAAVALAYAIGSLATGGYA
jgi:succinate dehydrogenase / fumarate reductase membrane anchor subunit